MNIDYALYDEQERKERLFKAAAEGKAGVSRKTGHVCLLEDEPDAIPIPFSYLLNPKGIVLPEDLETLPEAAPKRWQGTEKLHRGPAYTPPKQKRKPKPKKPRK